MRKKLIFATVIALSLALSLLAYPAAVQARPGTPVLPEKGLMAMSGGSLPGTTTFRYSGQTASAFFFNVDGNIETDVYLMVAESITHTPPAPKEGLQQFYVSMEQYDLTNYTIIMYASGFASPVNTQFGNHLSMASLVGSATLTTYYYSGDDSNPWIEGPPLAVSVNMTWTAISDVEHLTQTSHYQGPGYTINQHYNGTHRYAQATGSIATETTNLTPLASQGADLLLEKSGSVQIIYK